MSFINYLIEQKEIQVLTEKHDLVLQQIIDAIDSSHIDYSEDNIRFDIGSVTGQPKLKGLGLLIRKAQEDQVRLGKKGDEYCIVIDAESLPSRKELDIFLSGQEVYGQFANAYQSYMTNYFDKTKEYDITDTQRKLATNNRDSFEEYYTKLLQAITDHTGQYETALGDIDSQVAAMGNHGKKLALELAKENLRNEFIGKDSNDFVSKVLKLPGAEFVNDLDKTWKEKLESRLSSLYSGKYAV